MKTKAKTKAKQPSLMDKIKGGAENVYCYGYVYQLMKEAGVCPVCKIKFADIKRLCRDCYQYQLTYSRNYYHRVAKKRKLKVRSA